MAHLIDKDALVAEIESKFQKYWKMGEESDTLQDGNAKYWGGVLSCLNEVKTLINTLEVEEVDLQSEIDRVWDNTSDNFSEDGWKEFEDIAKHFFKLGLAASNPLTWEDIKILQEKSSEVFAEVAKGKVEYYSIYPTQQSFLEEVLKRFKEKKGE